MSNSTIYTICKVIVRVSTFAVACLCSLAYLGGKLGFAAVAAIALSHVVVIGSAFAMGYLEDRR